jgi:hypothetical protein
MVTFPLFGFIALILGMIYILFRTIFDFLILKVIVKNCAKIPSRNTCYAKRISGPGINRDFYHSLETEQLSLIILSYLEKLQLLQIEKEVHSVLESPRDSMIKLCSELFRNYGVNSYSNLYIQKSFSNLDYLKSSISYYVTKRIDRLPRIEGGSHTVRFTKEDLEKNILWLRE